MIEWKGDCRERCEILAEYMIEHRATVRSTAQRYGISKSTVHTDVTKQNGPPLSLQRGPFFFPYSADHGRRIPITRLFSNDIIKNQISERQC